MKKKESKNYEIKCEVCKELFTPENSGQNVCSNKCWDIKHGVVLKKKGEK